MIMFPDRTIPRESFIWVSWRARSEIFREAKPMVAAGREHLHVVREEDSSKRRQILDGARKVFMDLGFDGASMGEIARAARVSKGTLYVYFADKIRAVRSHRRAGSAPARPGRFQFRSRARRRDHAEGFRPGLHPSAVPARRRFGDPHRDGDRRAHAGGRPPLSICACWTRPSTGSPNISRPMSAPSDLTIDDCDLAASQFMELCKASLFLPFVFQAAPAPSEERMTRGRRQRDADVSGGVPGEVAAAGHSLRSPLPRHYIKRHVP